MHPLVAYSEQRGPFTRFIPTPNGEFRYVVYLVNIYGFRQKRPYDVDTDYWKMEYKLLSGAESADAWGWLPANVTRANASNRARKKLVGALGDSSSFGATLTAEARESWSMVVNGITRLLKAARAVRKLHFAEAATQLGLPYKEVLKKRWMWRTYHVSRRNGHGTMKVRQRVAVYKTEMDWGTGRSYAKTLASGWLMYSYGVKPLAQDIHNGMEVLTREFPAKQFSARGSETWEQSIEGSYYTTRRKAKSRCKVSAYVGVSNPNLWLANQLGLVNPAQWVMEAIPFSFVLDWVSNLSDVISQMTDFVGLELSRPLTTYIDVGEEQRLPLYSWIAPYHKRVTQIERTLAIPSAELVWAGERFHWQRGLNAISLLVGFLPAKAGK